MNWYKQAQYDEFSHTQPDDYHQSPDAQESNPYIVYEHAGYEAFERDCRYCP
jgi:hypothetical protein